MSTPSAEASIRDRSVEDIHLDNPFIYVIDTNLKIFAEAINVLSKISEQILFQPLANSLILSAFNSAKSAYGKITLSANFFSHCQPPRRTGDELPNDDVYCRISTRCALHIFKNIGTKGLHMASVESCQLELNPRSDFAIIHLQQEPAQIKRAYLLPMKEHSQSCDNFFTEKHRLKNKLTTQPRVLLTLFAGLDCRETKLVATGTQFAAHRYVLRDEASKVRKTEVSIPVDNFELYHIHLNSQIVICLKELRPILHFIDTCAMVLTLHFDRPGRPLIVAVEENLDFEAEFVLATLDEPERGVVAPQPQQQQQQPLNLARTQSQEGQVTPAQQSEGRAALAKIQLPVALQQHSASESPQQNENESPRFCASFC